MQRAEFLDLAEHVAEGFEGDFAFAERLLLLLHLVLVELLVRFFDQRDDVAHAEDAAGHAVGVEFLEVVELLADADELDRHAGDVLDGERRAAAGVAVELGEDDAVELERLVERLGAVDGVLAGHGVDDEVDLVGLDALVDALELVHQFVVDVQPAGGVEDDDVDAFFPGFLHSVVADDDRVGGAALGIDSEAELFADDVELVDGGGALQVGGDEQRLATLLLDHAAELAAGGGFAGALQAAHHEDAGIAGLQVQRMVDRAHQVDEFLVDDADELLRGIEGVEHASPMASTLTRSMKSLATS